MNLDCDHPAAYSEKLFGPKIENMKSVTMQILPPGAAIRLEVNDQNQKKHFGMIRRFGLLTHRDTGILPMLIDHDFPRKLSVNLAYNRSQISNGSVDHESHECSTFSIPPMAN